MQPSRRVYSVQRQQNMRLHERIIPYLERASLYHLTRLNKCWFWLDEPLVSAFIERWHLETHTFHMPFGECSITLQDMAYQLRLPVDENAVIGLRLVYGGWQTGLGVVLGVIQLPLPDKIKQFTVHFTWFHERFRMLPADASEDTIRIYARAYIMMLLSTQLYIFGDCHLWRGLTTRALTTGVQVHWHGYIDACVGWPTEMSRTWQALYSYYNLGSSGGSPLSSRMDLTTFLFRWHTGIDRCTEDLGLNIHITLLSSRWANYLRTSDGKEQRIIYVLMLDFVIMWEPYVALDVLVIVHPEILAEQHSRLWQHQDDKVVPRLGSVQHVPDTVLNINWLHGKDGRGGDRHDFCIGIIELILSWVSIEWLIQHICFCCRMPHLPILRERRFRTMPSIEGCRKCPLGYQCWTCWIAGVWSGDDTLEQKAGGDGGGQGDHRMRRSCVRGRGVGLGSAAARHSDIPTASCMVTSLIMVLVGTQKLGFGGHIYPCIEFSNIP
ncbi:hypothetical protein Ahy_B06g084659 [Arachis hypogaea]|uniref:Aminotransferase-like plant mobile domain-containing protein n=1 Tax=Arachis hypogaea TaxID=3818 RepID=A0A444YSF4_ARAHY|nr:hypothetical protein Ahy_B06g084659 [Arachis hypogaea]